MPVVTDITQLSTTAASNYPVGTENANTVDDYIRQQSAFIAQLRGRAIYAADYGATGDGVTDDTTAIAAAHAAAIAADSPVILTAGKNYKFDGPALTGGACRFICLGGVASSSGDGAMATITLGTGIWFYDDSAYCPFVHLEGIKFSGGAGAYRNTRTDATNAVVYPTINRCYFYAFTKCAIQHNSTDWPYWKITDCEFDASTHVSTIGIALSGLGDGVVVRGCAFGAMQVAIKLAGGGNNCYIYQNDILNGDINHASAVDCVGVWIVPTATAVNCGQGNVIAENKFGSERMTTATDRRIFIGDALAAGNAGETYPDTVSVSTGFSKGLVVRNNLFAGYGTNPTKALVTTATGQFSATICDNQLSGTAPDYLLEFLTTPAYASNTNYVADIRGNFLPLGATIYPTSNSNYANAVRAQDFQAGLSGAQARGAANSYVKIISRFPTRTVTGATTGAAATDPLGGSDAYTITHGATGGGLLQEASASIPVEAGSTVWLEFDYIAPGADYGYVDCNLILDATTVWTGVLKAESGAPWRHVCVPVPVLTATGGLVRLATNSTAAGGSTTVITIARPVLYQAAAPTQVLSSEARQVVAMADAGTTNGVVGTLMNSTSGTIAAHTVVLPTVKSDGAEFRLATRGAITSLTITGTTSSAPTSLTAGGYAAWTYNASNTMWYRTA